MNESRVLTRRGEAAPPLSVRRSLSAAPSRTTNRSSQEKRAKIINAEGESLAAAALGDASDTMVAYPLALELRNMQSLIEIGVDKNTAVVFPAPLVTTIAELGSFLAREAAAANPGGPLVTSDPPAPAAVANGTPVPLAKST